MSEVPTPTSSRRPNAHRALGSRLGIAATALLLGTATVQGVTAQEVRLDDGRVLVGKFVTKGDTLEITTRDGVVLVPANQVRGTRDEDDLRRALAEKARGEAKTAFAHLHLAMDARSYGLEPELWKHLDLAVTLPQSTAPDAPTATDAAPNQTTAGLTSRASARSPLQRRIDDFLAQLEPELLARKYRTASTRVRVHQLLDCLRVESGPGRTAAVVELLVREPNADQDLRTEARRNSTERRRTAALAALQRREIAGNDHFVLRTAILDKSPEVRQAAIDLSRGIDDAGAVAYLAPGLMHSNARIRMRTAEAFAGLGHPDAVKLLVLAGPNAGVALAAADHGVRANVAFLQQQAYIRDFDVEVAQAAFIADPKVDVLQSGSVLDVTVIGVEQVRTIVHYYRQALKKLTNSDPGGNAGTWSNWLASLPSGQAATTDKR
ncbi:MAG TPA: HEAT repeat domain-containing protein [Planctomycetota bacterium]|nr:HEAT repeat domain-containing protein [Planctomycetota bacterium]